MAMIYCRVETGDRKCRERRWRGVTHRRVALVAAMLLSLLLVRDAFCSPEWEIAFEPGLYSFAEIASTLSKGAKVRCDPRLGDRAAYVHLRKRPRGETLAILEQSLAVRFLPTSGDDALMVPDPVTVREESRWRSALAKSAEQRIDDRIPRGGTVSIRTKPDWTSLFRNGVTIEQGPAPADVLRSRVDATVRTERWLDFASPSLSVMMHERTNYYAGGRWPLASSAVRPATVVDLAPGKDADARLDLLMSQCGTEAVDWLARERHTTQIVSLSALARRPLRDRSAGADKSVDSLSQYLSRWCESTDADAVMEIFPLAEALPAGIPPASLSDLWHEGMASDFLARWTLAESNGVLYIQNRMAFLDRERRHPAAALIRLMRGKRHPIAKTRFSFAPLLRMEDWLDYVRAADPREHGHWSSPDMRASAFRRETYHDFPVAHLDSAFRVLWAWDRSALIRSGKGREILREASQRAETGISDLFTESLDELISLEIAVPRLAETGDEEQDGMLAYFEEAPFRNHIRNYGATTIDIEVKPYDEQYDQVELILEVFEGQGKQFDSGAYFLYPRVTKKKR